VSKLKQIQDAVPAVINDDKNDLPKGVRTHTPLTYLTFLTCLALACCRARKTYNPSMNTVAADHA
jgi:hypothetical protein